MNVLALKRYGQLGASSRMRFYQYLTALRTAGVRIEIAALYSFRLCERSASLPISFQWVKRALAEQRPSIGKMYLAGFQFSAFTRALFRKIHRIFRKLKPDKPSRFDLCVLVNSLDSGGGEKVAATLYSEYKEMGKRVVFICLEKNDFFHVNGEVVYLSSRSGKSEGRVFKILFLVFFAWRLRSLVNRYGISVVQSHLYRSNYVNVLAKLMGSCHTAQIVNHGIVSWYQGRKGLAGFINLSLVKCLYRRADQIVLVSRGMKEDMVQVGCPHADMRIIYNPFDLHSIQRLKEEPIHDFEFESDRKYLICVGRLEKIKRFDDVVRALAGLLEKGLNIELLFLGDGPEQGNISALSEKLNIGDRVHFLGRVSNPFKYMRKADIFVSSSEFEGFSNVIVEALAVGTPVVATDCPSGPREILAPSMDAKYKLQKGVAENADFGVLVPVGETKAIVNSILNLITNPGRAAEYARKGPVRAKEFSKELIAMQYVKALSSIQP